jgi:hypothetical protein
LRSYGLEALLKNLTGQLHGTQKIKLAINSRDKKHKNLLERKLNVTYKNPIKGIESF